MIWIIGAGPMAEEYAKVLLAMDVEFKVFGRSQTSADSFARKTKIPVYAGGLEQIISASRHGTPDSAIVAVTPSQLSSVATCLLDCGIKNLLVEKPGALDQQAIRSLRDQADRMSASVLIAYNRRFFASTRRAREMINNDGGVTSFSFELTEWAHIIGGLEKEEPVLHAWFLANTTHVVDLAWFLGGFPAEISSYQSGSLPWHPASSRYSGAGISESGALFSYHGDWQAPGRWALELCTQHNRYIFRPMEQLQIQETGSISITRVELDDRLDREFKPGIYLQTERFLAGDTAGFCTLEEQLKAWPLYEQMAGYVGP